MAFVSPRAKIANTEVVVLDVLSTYCPAKNAANARINKKRMENE